MMRAVNKFSGISGLCLNPSKCVTFFGNVPSAVQDFTIATSGFNRGTLPVTYLGLPLVSRKLYARDCQPLLSKITSKFESWCCNSISQAGRAQLIKSVVFGMQNHWTMYLFLPKIILKRLQSIMARFLWKGSSSGFCHYKVNWKTCCLRKDEGGLGFKELLSWNQSAVFLQVWRIIKNSEDSLWLCWVHKWLLKRKGFWTMAVPPGCSWGLRKILNARGAVINHVSFRVGIHSQFLLWHDPWCGNKPLIDLLGRRAVSSLESEDMATVSTIINNGSWHLGISNDYTVRELRLLCSRTMLYSNDDILWDGNSSNNLKIGMIWQNLRPTGFKPTWYNFVWSKFSVPRFAFVSWLVVQERLLTKDRMIRFRMNIINRCELCGADAESHAHIFCHCNYIRQIYSNWYIGINLSWPELKAGRVCLGSGISRIDTELTNLFVSIVLYMVWRERNMRVHDNTHRRGSTSLSLEIKENMRAKLASCAYFQQCINRDPSLTTHLY